MSECSVAWSDRCGLLRMGEFVRDRGPTPNPTPRPLRLLLAGILGLFAICSPAATYHLDSGSGNDSADGLTPATAWQSLAKANSVVYMPGDRLLLKSGAAWTGRLQPQGSGTSGASIVIDRYGEGPKPSILGGGIAGGAVTLQNSSYWTIRNLDVSNTGTAEPKKMGILVRNDCVGTLSGIEIRDCDIHDVTGVMPNYADGKKAAGSCSRSRAGGVRGRRGQAVHWSMDQRGVRKAGGRGVFLREGSIARPDTANT